MIGFLNKVYHLFGIVWLIALLLLYYVFNPELDSFFPECLFHTLFALDCPGCGSQRAINSLSHGDFLKAADYNIMLVMSIPFLATHFACKSYFHFSKKKVGLTVMDSPLLKKIFIGLLVAFWILRNIPIQPFLYLAA